MRRLILGASLGLGLCGWWLFAAESPPSIHSLPEQVRTQLTRMFPDTDLVRIEMRDMGGRTAYELKGVSRDGQRNFWMYVTRNAEVIRIAEQLKQKELSPAVQSAAVKAFPGAVIETAEKKSEIKVTYFLKVNEHGKRFDLLLSPEGNILEIRKDIQLTNAGIAN